MMKVYRECGIYLSNLHLNNHIYLHNCLFRGVFSGALRDSSAPSAAAAKCSLITDGLVRSSSSWALSLASVKQPTPEALYACAVSICPLLGEYIEFH